MVFLPLTTALLLGQSQNSPPPSGTVAILGVKIEVGDGRVIPDANVVVTNGRITAVGTAIAVAGVTNTIDGKGLTLYPGFIDAYSTRGLKIPEARPAGTPPDNRYTAPATMWHGNRRGIRSELSAAKILDLKDETESRRSQGVTTVLLSAGGGMFAGNAAMVNMTTQGTVLREDVATEMGFRAVGGGGYPGTMFGIAATVRQTLADAQAYARQEKPTEDPALAGLKKAVTGEVPALFYTANSRDATRAARVAQEFGLKLIVNGGSDVYRVADLLKSRRAAAIVSVDAPDAPSRAPQTGPDATPKEVLEDRYDLWVERSSNARKLVEAGIPIAFGQSPAMGDGYLAGVRKHIAAGLPREAALKAMTSGAAGIFGVSAQVGTVEVGKLANFVLMSGDFADEKSEIRMVVVEGTVFPKKEASK